MSELDYYALATMALAQELRDIRKLLERKLR
jgi:hypothetical protein